MSPRNVAKSTAKRNLKSTAKPKIQATAKLNEPSGKKPKVAPPPVFSAQFCRFMMRGWKAASGKITPKVRGLARFVARRAALSARFGQDVLVIPTGSEKVRANDTHYRFRPGTDFYYLTGHLEADCVLVLKPKLRGCGHEAWLFAEDNLGRRDTTFFADSKKGALWVGPRLGLAQCKVRFGVHRCLPLSQLPAFLGGLGTGRRRPRVRCLRGVDAAVDNALGAQTVHDQELATHLSELRLIKDDMELAALKRACASTRRGFEDMIAALKQAHSEREVEGIFNLRARVEGNDVGYNTIAASGSHACVLHWARNDGRIGPTDLILIDAGVEGPELYTADVTRTLPVRGRFSRDQKRVYELVLAAQEAGLAVVKPGNDFMAPNRAAMQVLAYGLEDLGILASAQEALHSDKQWYRRYTLHNVSHMLGLDVHDCAHARSQEYRYGALKPGMVLTVEPGLYFQPDDLTVPKRYRGIGVRIEDDVVVTRKGFRFLSELPRTCRDVEAWMRQVIRQGRSPFVSDL